jgi:hypothetical protein
VRLPLRRSRRGRGAEKIAGCREVSSFTSACSALTDASNNCSIERAALPFLQQVKRGVHARNVMGSPIRLFADIAVALSSSRATAQFLDSDNERPQAR